MQFNITQGDYEWSENDYTGKKLGFYRLTAADAKDSTFSPAASDFSGWTVDSNEVSRSFTSDTGKTGTAANRTVLIKYSHLLTNAVQTTFQGYLDF